jgi:hypothetical protein
LKIKPVITILSLLFLLVVIILLPDLIDGDKSIDKLNSIGSKKIQAQTCRLNDGACLFNSSYFGAIRVEVSPRDFPAFKPLLATVSVEGTFLKAVSLSLQGKDMYMGPNSTILTKVNENTWEGKTSIPVCSVDPSMTWLVQLTLMGKETERRVFEVKSAH